jgi:hypothetical protein
MRHEHSLAAAVLLSVAGAACGQSFTNGDFEGGTLAGWTVTNTANGVGAPGSVTTIDIDGTGGPLGPSPAATFMVGQQAFTSGQQEGVEMTQTLNLTAGVQYAVAFDWSAQRLASAGNVGGIFSLIVDGVIIASVDAGNISGTEPAYGHFAANYTPAASGNASVGIRITRPYLIPGDLSNYVDNISITGGASCYANCDNSTTPPALNVQDFSCFLNRFASGDTWANCDEGTVPPVLNVQDFSCFLNRFASGCS